MKTLEKPHPLRVYDGHINTRSGLKLNIFDPQPDQISIGDIAAGLAFKAHFAGQTPKLFSIAQHSVMVCQEVINKEFPDGDIVGDLPLVALLHDASEAFIGDMIKPLKIHMPDFCRVEDGLTRAIFAKFKLSVDDLTEVKWADKLVQDLEFDAFYNSGSIQYWSAMKSYNRFMSMFEQLTGNN